MQQFKQTVELRSSHKQERVYAMHEGNKENMHTSAS